MGQPTASAEAKPDFNADLILLANLAKALSHPGRLRILQILAERQSCICGDIVEVLPFSQSTVSQHLKELKRVELVTGEIDGPRTCYCLNNKTLAKAQTVFMGLFAKINCCGIKGETHEFE
ncbi:MAG: winged helix-turn-helix transcriptional regulator [bacterium]|nr:winged helix-turn-helix transcriptional regulator [bacterium]